MMNHSEEILSKLDAILELLQSTAPAPYSIEEAAVYLKVSKSFIYKLTSNNVLPFYKPGGKKILFDKRELDAWIRSHRVSSQGELERDVSTLTARRPFP